eukprot:symbB.v1.2.007329.t1/scaffold420.1/size231607/5
MSNISRSMNDRILKVDDDAGIILFDFRLALLVLDVLAPTGVDGRHHCAVSRGGKAEGRKQTCLTHGPASRWTRGHRVASARCQEIQLWNYTLHLPGPT